MKDNKNLILAVPKGRILEELLPLLKKNNIEFSKDFFEDNRKLFFDTNIDDVKVIKCRSFDVATFVAGGAADIGVCGSDVVCEFNYDNIFNVADLGIGKCRLSVAGVKNEGFSERNIRVASKYPNLTNKFFHDKGVNVEIVKLNGAIELAAKLNISDYIVDLVSSGNTLKENGLSELDELVKVSSQLIVNKSSMVTKNKKVNEFINLLNV
jgi:ATP phosphoribosyltransferase